MLKTTWYYQVTTVPTAQHPSIVRTAKAEKRLKDKLTREVSFRILLFSVSKFNVSLICRRV
jgi:hypothetical protein